MFQVAAASYSGLSLPTLKLLPYELAKEQVPTNVAERIVHDSVREFGRFAAAGGKVLFGTDVDYMTDTDPSQEYELMALAGMSPMQILASLTTTPAERWNEAQKRGRLAPGMDADIVVLNDDPARSARHFASVRCALRGGSAASPSISSIGVIRPTRSPYSPMPAEIAPMFCGNADGWAVGLIRSRM